MRPSIFAVALLLGGPAGAADKAPTEKEQAEAKVKEATAAVEKQKEILALRQAVLKAATDAEKADEAANLARKAAEADSSSTTLKNAAEVAAARALEARTVAKALQNALAATEDKAAREQAKAKTEANREFLGVKFNFGFGGVFFSGRVEEAQVVGEGDNARVLVTKDAARRPALVLEAHRLIDPKGNRRPKDRTRAPDESGELLDAERVVFGIGPFLALQTSKNEVIDTIGLGVMGGIRVGKESAFNIGVGAMLDPSAKYLPPGYVDGQAPPKGYVPGEKLPNGATAVSLITKGKLGLIVLASFTF